MDEITVLLCPAFGKSNVRYLIATPIKLLFCFRSNNFRINFIYEFTLCLFIFIENCQIYFFVSSDPSQRFSTFVFGLSEHTVKLPCSTLFT